MAARCPASSCLSRNGHHWSESRWRRQGRRRPRKLPHRLLCDRIVVPGVALLVRACDPRFGHDRHRRCCDWSDRRSFWNCRAQRGRRYHRLRGLGTDETDGQWRPSATCQRDGALRSNRKDAREDGKLARQVAREWWLARQVARESWLANRGVRESAVACESLQRRA